MRIIEFRPPRIAVVFTIAAVVCHVLWFSGSYTPHPLVVIGASAGLTGFLLMMWPWWLFRRDRLAICPTAATASILQNGPYRFSRNPMYLGMVLMLLGLALSIGTPPFYLSCLAYFILLDTVFCRFEEKKLIAAFGEPYVRYMQRVRRWL